MRPIFKTWLTICLFMPLAAHATNREQQLPSSFNGHAAKSHSSIVTTASKTPESSEAVKSEKVAHGKTTHKKNAQQTKSSKQASTTKHSKTSNHASRRSAHGKSSVASIAPPQMGAKQSSVVLSRAVNVLGTPYHWGGSSPSKGFDCSGLVKYAFRDVNTVDLPRTSNAMAEGHGQRVDRKDLKPGDLLFFKIKGHQVNHVAIYLGNNRFIHAPRRGKAVTIDTLSKPYWDDHYVLAKRVLPKQSSKPTLRLSQR
ncbi:C40 family peptidase [Pseudomonas sp. 10B1]|uniref:C40 family peptidase n=1 Tax=unclassified Pseudomonas TaxID=196821 RepID=UPI002AB47892|nr:MULTISPECIES: C40 family peptidase [unclassified Pseudomonas]MDY7562801.1 C40 family peptidase [Pseudomonas sp. AB6]MEA9978669.1 C40 family peptidase [Pseudomonas sp. RTS4]MEA9994400.1 C40 family peptidase [Pseudomonas sp. AA4]MEB0087818.1 C40 family peptidase [Pseudomonas sp. RTI1]MEB0126654.1 C40 family peptidase [Pseudomonas sp. CCC1.2]